MAMSVVECLVKHVNDQASCFYRLWRRGGKTPAAIVADLRSVADDYNDDVEEDYLSFGVFFLDLIDGLDSNEVFELGSELLVLKEKYEKVYR